MLKDVQNSIKAKLYDFTYSPFMSSMIISWIIINHKYILIYMASYDLDKKLELLKSYDFSIFSIPFAMNIWLPIGFGLFYTFLYPLASKWFYEYTLHSNKKLKGIKQKIEDETPLTQKEARSLRESITDLTENNYALEKKLIESENRYKIKLQDAMKENIPTASVPSKKKEMTNLPKIIQPKEDDKTKFLRYLYESNYKPVLETTLLDEIFTQAEIKRPKAKNILVELLEGNILTKKSSNYKHEQVISITNKGNDLLIQLFDKEK